MNRIFLTTATLIMLLVASLHSTHAAPNTASGAQNPGALSATGNQDDYISLRWMVYMMILSLPFAPSQTHYAPLNIPVNIPRLHIPEPKMPEVSIPKLKIPRTNIPKLKKPQL